jgi:hypothetical protein
MEAEAHDCASANAGLPMLTALVAVLNLPTYLLLGWSIFGSWQEAGAAILAGFHVLGRRNSTVEHLAELCD